MPVPVDLQEDDWPRSNPLVETGNTRPAAVYACERHAVKGW